MSTILKNKRPQGRGKNAAALATMALLAAASITFISPQSAEAQIGVYGGGGGGGGGGVSRGQGGTGFAGGINNGGDGQPGVGGNGGNAVCNDISGWGTCTPDLGSPAVSMAGGNGGNISFEITNNVSTTSLAVIAGDGGEDGDNGLYSTNGGKGGNADLTIKPGSGVTNLTANTVDVRGGTANGSGGGGKATVDLSGVTLNSIALCIITSYDGGAKFDVGTWSFDTNSSLNLVNTNGNAGDLEFTADNLLLKGGNLFSAQGSSNFGAGDVNIGTLKLQDASSFTNMGWGKYGKDAADNFYIKNLMATGHGNKLGSNNLTNSFEVNYANPDKRFETITFDLTGAISGSSTSILQLVGGDTKVHFGALTTAADFRNAIQIVLDNFDMSGMSATDQVVLMDTNGGATINLAGSHLNDPSGAKVVDGYDQWQGLTKYLGYITNESGKLVFMSNGFQLNQTDYYKPYFEGMLAGHLTVRDAQYNIFDVLKKSAMSEDGLMVNLSLRGSSIESKTGSHVDNDMFNAALALAWKCQTAIGSTTAGAFVEAGTGSYDTYNHFRTIGEVRGEGDNNYVGGGLFFHNEFSSRTYIEASVRGGRLDNDFKVRDVSRASYDIDTSYYGAHFGLGQLFYLTNCADLDVYGQFLWTRTEDKSFRTDAGERFKFDSTDSYRTRLGARLTQCVDDGDVKGYIGAAWEYEFDGEVDGRTPSGKLRSKDRPDLKGSSAFGEAGIIIQPVDSAVSVDFGLFGLAGQQKGLGGTAGLKYEF